METKANTPETSFSSPETFERQWRDLRGQIRSWWDRLSESDLEQIGGKKAQLIRLVQDKYGYIRERAEQEVDRRLREYRDTMEGGGGGAQGTAAGVAAMAGEVGTKMQDMATTAASSVTSTVSGAGTYLQDVPGDLIGLIRRYPLPSLFVGIGIGFLLARSLGQMRLPSLGGGDWRAKARERESGYPDAMIQCVRCGELVRQADMVSHSTECTGTGLAGHGGSPT